MTLNITAFGHSKPRSRSTNIATSPTVNTIEKHKRLYRHRPIARGALGVEALP